MEEGEIGGGNSSKVFSEVIHLEDLCKDILRVETEWFMVANTHHSLTSEDLPQSRSGKPIAPLLEESSFRCDVECKERIQASPLEFEVHPFRALLEKNLFGEFCTEEGSNKSKSKNNLIGDYMAWAYLNKHDFYRWVDMDEYGMQGGITDQLKVEDNGVKYSSQSLSSSSSSSSISRILLEVNNNSTSAPTTPPTCSNNNFKACRRDHACIWKRRARMCKVAICADFKRFNCIRASGCEWKSKTCRKRVIQEPTSMPTTLPTFTPTTRVPTTKPKLTLRPTPGPTTRVPTAVPKPGTPSPTFNQCRVLSKKGRTVCRNEEGCHWYSGRKWNRCDYPPPTKAPTMNPCPALASLKTCWSRRKYCRWSKGKCSRR